MPQKVINPILFIETFLKHESGWFWLFNMTTKTNILVESILSQIKKGNEETSFQDIVCNS